MKEQLKPQVRPCIAYSMVLFVMLDGSAERANRTLRYEFYQFYHGIPKPGELRKALKDYLRLYNHFRAHQTLKQDTSVSYLSRAT